MATLPSVVGTYTLPVLLVLFSVLESDVVTGSVVVDDVSSVATDDVLVDAGLYVVLGELGVVVTGVVVFTVPVLYSLYPYEFSL